MGFFPIGDDNSLRVTTPYVVYGLLLANAIMWFVQLSLGESFTGGYATVPFEIMNGVDLTGIQRVDIGGKEFAIREYPGPSPIYVTLLSSMFMHGSWMHILGNLLYLVIFADQIEDLLGHGRFLLFYLLCGLAAGFAQILWDPSSIIPCLGASGAIAGCLGAYLVRHPTNAVRVLIFRDIINVPAFIVLGGWIALQVFSQIGSSASKASGVAYLAHIGGFAAGVVLVFVLAIGRRRRDQDER
ncbi:MAG: rhomboid family intramembrane serine protease [Planctomycetes bacterium]|nr:rhomboid family intramembrane serine protease [Planctomycetota bacterium]